MPVEDLYTAPAVADPIAWLSGLRLAQTINNVDARAATMADVPFPATETVIGQAPVGDAATVAAAVAAAKTALPGWAGTPWAKRQDLLRAFADALLADAPTLATLVTCETGRPLRKSWGEIELAVRYLRIVADTEPSTRAIAHPRAAIQLITKPLGVVAAIAPWNAPVVLAVAKIGNALVAGNTQVLKPSPFTPLSALRLGQLARKLLPPGVLNIITGGADVGAALTAHPDVAKISFTGSTATGKIIAAQAATSLKRVTLELGGNDPCIVLKDANIGAAVDAALRTGLTNGGAFCAGIKRLYVHEAVYDDYVADMRAKLKSVTIGNGFDPAVEMGPIQNRPQYKRVVKLRDQALAMGGEVLAGGGDVPSPGLFVAPMLIGGLDRAAPLVVEEQFGPIIPILRFSDAEDALTQANATSYGLGGSIWSKNIDQAMALADRLEVGSAWINQHGAFDMSVPMPFAKDSGVGMDYGGFGVQEHSQHRIVNVLPA